MAEGSFRMYQLLYGSFLFPRRLFGFCFSGGFYVLHTYQVLCFVFFSVAFFGRRQLGSGSISLQDSWVGSTVLKIRHE